MKITYITEAVKIPSKEQKKVTADDIHNANLPYAKAQLVKEINSELVAFTPNFARVEDMLIPAYKDENGNIDFSLAINVESDLDVPEPDKFCVVITLCPQTKYSFSKYDLLLTDKSYTAYIMLNILFKHIVKKHSEISKIDIQPMWVSTYDPTVMQMYCGGTLLKQQLYDAIQAVKSYAFKSIQIHGIKIYMQYDVKSKYSDYLITRINDLFEFVDNILTSCELSDDLSLRIINDSKESASECFECICKSNISLKFNYAYVYDRYNIYKPFIFNSPNEILNIAKDKETFYIKCDITRLLAFMKKYDGKYYDDKYIKSPGSLMFLANIDLAYPDLMDDTMYYFGSSGAKVDIVYYPINSSFYMKYKDIEINIDTVVNCIIEENDIDVNTFYPETCQRDVLIRMIQKGISDAYYEIVNKQS